MDGAGRQRISVVVADFEHVLVPADAEVVDLVEWEQRQHEERANGSVAPTKIVQAPRVVDGLEGCAVLGRAHPRQIYDLKAAVERRV